MGDEGTDNRMHRETLRKADWPIFNNRVLFPSSTYLLLSCITTSCFLFVKLHNIGLEGRCDSVRLLSFISVLSVVCPFSTVALKRGQDSVTTLKWADFGVEETRVLLFIFYFF